MPPLASCWLRLCSELSLPPSVSPSRQTACSHTHHCRMARDNQIAAPDSRVSTGQHVSRSAWIICKTNAFCTLASASVDRAGRFQVMKHLDYSAKWISRTQLHIKRWKRSEREREEGRERKRERGEREREET